MTLPCATTDDNIYKETHFKSFFNKDLSYYIKNVVEERVCDGYVSLSKVVQCIHTGDYVATPCTFIDYETTLCMRIDYTEHKTLE